MNNIRLIKLINNLNMTDKEKTKELYEAIVNIPLQEIKRLKLYLILLGENLKHNSSVEFNPDEFKPKEFIIYLWWLKKI